MKRLSMFLMCLLAMMAASLSAKAQEVTITLWPGWNWISYPNAEVMDVASALGEFVPMNGDKIKSQFTNSAYYNGYWRGGVTHFMPGYGYMYYSNRDEMVSFVFNKPPMPTGTLTVTTGELANITSTTAVCGGSAVSNDGTTILMKGVCWATHPQPTTNDSYTEDGSGPGAFTAEMTELVAETEYYVRAYAVSVKGINYGEELSFTTNADFIVFADPAVKAICIEHWDTNGDGELSYAEAAAVTALNDAFHGHPITSFNEFQYFTGVTSIEDLAFDYNSNLFSIIIPNSVTSIGYSFRNCENLNSFYLPASVTSIHHGAFESCRHMEQIVVAENNPVYDSREGCNAIIETASNTMIIGCNNTIIPNTVTTVEGTTFVGKDITSLYIPSSVVSFGGFIWCPIEQIVVEEGNSVYDSRNNCNAIIETSTNKLVKGCKNTAIPNTVTTIGESAFIDCEELTSITIPASVTSIGLWAFRIIGLTTMTIEATTPPELYYGDPWHSTFGGVSLDIPIYIPCGTLEAFQNAEVWSRFTNFIEMCNGDAPTGAIDGKFTINNSGDQVYFSKGNLQYQASTNTWRFALNQWETVGVEDNESASATFDGWIDKYDWATSGYPHIEDCYQPWSSCGMLLAYGEEAYNLYNESGQADWGYNAISNGGNVENSGWRTVKGNEWSYLFNYRTTLSGIRYAKATINGEYGVILFPDDWNADWYAVNNYNESAASYNSNIISGDVWESVFEAHGAVLLPQSSEYPDIRYCSASKSYTGQIWILFFADTFLTPQVSTYVGKYAVRLVHPAE